MSSSTWRDRLVTSAIVISNVGIFALHLHGDARLRRVLQLTGASHILAFLAFAFHARRRLLTTEGGGGWRILTANMTVGALSHFVAASVVAAGVKWRVIDRFLNRVDGGASLSSEFYSRNGDVFLVVLTGAFSAWYAWSHAVRDQPHQTDAHSKATSIAQEVERTAKKQKQQQQQQHSQEMARAESDAVVASVSSGVEPAPPPDSPYANAKKIDYAAVANKLAAKDDYPRLAALKGLQRIEGVLSSESDDADAALRTVRQEVDRLAAAAEADAKAQKHNDVVSKAAEVVEWAADKGVEELMQMDMSDLVMAKTVADINANSANSEVRFVPAKNMMAIHPITRDTADVKCNARADALRSCADILKSNGMRLSEDLIQGQAGLAAMRSVNGFQVIQMTDDAELTKRKYVTFEGNGRCVAIHRAADKIDADSLLVEVRVFHFKDKRTLEKMRSAVRATQKAKGVPVTE